MYRTEHQVGCTGGHFSTLVSEVSELHDQREVLHLPMPFKNQLVYLRPLSDRRQISSTLREKECAQCELVEHVRIISVKTMSDALTIDVELISNIDYFMKIMKLVDEEFLIRDYKITKETSVTGSLLFTKEDSKALKSAQYFHVHDYQKPIYSTNIGVSGQVQYVSLANRTNKVKESSITLAKCILLSFEKCLNVHFQDYQKKLTTAQSAQFLMKESEMTTNPFQQDLKLANWWLSLNETQKMAHLETAKDMEREIVLEHNTLKFETVQESSEGEDSDRQFNGGFQQIQCDKTVTEIFNQKRRRNRKDRKQAFEDSDRTSSSGLTNPYELSKKQMRNMYGDFVSDGEEQDEFYGDKTEATLQNHQSQLFLSVDNSMYKCRQNLVHRALQTSDLQSCLMFIKQLSLSRSFENSMRENAQGEITPKQMPDVKRILHQKFYDYLEDAFQKSVLADLLSDQETGDQESQRKKKNRKKNRKNKKKDDQQPKEQLTQKIEAKTAPTLEMLKMSLGLNSNQHDEEEKELPKIEINFDNFRSELPFYSSEKLRERERQLFVEEQGTPQSDSSAEMARAVDKVKMTQQMQEDQLMFLQRKMEKISTCEQMLNEGALEKGGYDSQVLMSLLQEDSQDDYDARTVQDSDALLMRYEEERTGLLTNQVHFDKYQSTTELYDEQKLLAKTREEREQIKFLFPDTTTKFSIQAQSDSDSDKEAVDKLYRQIQSIQEEPPAKVEEVKRKKIKSSRRKKNKKQQAKQEPPQPQIETPAKNQLSATTGAAQIAAAATEIVLKQLVAVEVDEIEVVNNVAEQDDDEVLAVKQQVSVRKNNFFSDDSESVQSSNHSVTYLNGRVSRSRDRATPKKQSQRSAPKQKQAQRQETTAANQQQQQKKKSKKQPVGSNNAVQQVLDRPISVFSLPTQILASPQRTPKADFKLLQLSDNIKIPSRGKSSINSTNHLEEIEHQRTIQDLDYLFSSNSDKSKLRSLSVERKDISQFNDLLLDEQLEDNTALSVHIEKKRDQSQLQEPSLDSQVDKAIKSITVTQQQQQSQTKPEKHQPDRKKQKGSTKQQQQQPQQQQQRPQPTTSGMNKQKFSQTQQHQSSYQAKQPAVSKQQPQFKAKATTATKPVDIKPKSTFDSYDSMFQNIYGAPTSKETPQPQQQVAVAEKQEPMVASSVNTSAGSLEEPISKTVTQPVEGDSLTKTTKLNKKQQLKAAKLQEHGAMVSPNFFLKKQSNEVADHPIETKGLPSNYVDSSFQTSEPFTPSKQQTPFVMPLNFPDNKGIVQERGQQFPPQSSVFASQTFQSQVNVNIFQQPGGFIQNSNFYNPFQAQQQQSQMQMSQQYPQQPQIFGVPPQIQSGAPHFYPQQQLYPQQPYPQQYYYPQQIPFTPQKMYYQQYPNQLAPFEIVPLVDQIQLDKRHSGQWEFHEANFHSTLGNQITLVQQKLDSYLTESDNARDHCFQLISKIAQDTFPELQLTLDVYGSMATKLAIDTSDMDIAIYGVQMEARSQALEQLHRKLKECKSVIGNQLILTASVPVIKLEMGFAGLAEDFKSFVGQSEGSQMEPVKIGKIKSMKIDLVMNDSNELSNHQTKLCADFIKKQMCEHPFLKPLTLTLKKYLGHKNLNSPFQGTMSSYGLVLLVLALLKDMNCVYPRFEFYAPNNMWLGRAFTHFLSVYGDSANFNESIIVSGALRFELSQDSGQGQRSLVIQDPVDASNNVGKQIYNFFSNVQEQLIITQRVMLHRFKLIQAKMCEREIICHDLQGLLSQIKPHQKDKEHSLDKQMQMQLDQIDQEIKHMQQELLDRIIMCDLQNELQAIRRDEVEDRQRNIYHTTKQMATIMQSFESGNQGRSLNSQLQKLFFHPSQLGMMQQPTLQQQNNSKPLDSFNSFYDAQTMEVPQQYSHAASGVYHEPRK